MVEAPNRKDGFVICPHCGSHICYAQDTENGQETYMCISCGYTSTSDMIEGSDVEKIMTAKHPNLYKDLKFVDSNNRVWYPAVITVPGKGMVYIDGSDSENWEWASTPMRELTAKEKKLKKYKDQKYIAEPGLTQHFGKEGFVVAATSIGIFGE